MSESHTIMDGKVHIYKRPNSCIWQCSIYLGGRNHRQSTAQINLERAIEFAQEWYIERVVEDRVRRSGEPASLHGRGQGESATRPRQNLRERTFRQAAAAFVSEFQVLTEGERNAEYVRSKERILRLYVLPFLGDDAMSAVTAGRIQDYRVHRLTPTDVLHTPRYKRAGREFKGAPRKWRRPSRSSLHKEIVCIRQVLKTANRKGWIAAIPDMSAPYKGSGKISHRAWFSPEEYRRLYEATRERAKNPKNERWRRECENLHDFVLFMVNTGLRPDEAQRLQFQDVAVEDDEDTGERILVIEVRGKRGVGYCKSMPGAVLPFQRLQDRNASKPEDLVFGKVQRELLNAILNDLNLKTDRDGNQRTAYSLRHTYICLRLMEGADIYQVAKNCRTSVEMIEKYYASHIKNTLDASAINVRKPPRRRRSDPTVR